MFAPPGDVCGLELGLLESLTLDAVIVAATGLEIFLFTST
jgi:hypothetical protein